MPRGNKNNPSIWESLRNAWKVDDIRKKLIYTFMMLLLFRLVGVILAPGVDYSLVQSKMATNNLPLLDLVNMMTGNNFQNMTIMAMGITPYINASIIMQLLTIAIPALERMQKSGQEGQKRIAQITRYVTVGLALFQAIGLVSSVGVIKSGWYNYVLVGVSMAGGSALAMWIGERITEKGIGNGISLLITAGIVSNLFNGVVGLTGDALGAE
ncbi:MAG: preprotein translocase subunit SecY, partial [Eubacteriales bacterium]|nr:preprotein translocase subunit SecY [Eubacteriales bacterium]